MIQCPNCGTSMPDDKRFCTNCGRSLSGAAPQDTAEQTSGHAEGAVPDETAEQQESARTEGAASSGNAAHAAPPYTQPVQQRPVFIQKDDARLAPVGIWMWLGVFLIACIPLVNVIMMIIWACCAQRQSLKNYARAMVICYLVALVLLVLVGIVFAYTGIRWNDMLYEHFLFY